MSKKIENDLTKFLVNQIFPWGWYHTATLQVISNVWVHSYVKFGINGPKRESWWFLMDSFVWECFTHLHQVVVVNYFERISVCCSHNQALQYMQRVQMDGHGIGFDWLSPHLARHAVAVDLGPLKRPTEVPRDISKDHVFNIIFHHCNLILTRF